MKMYVNDFFELFERYYINNCNQFSVRKIQATCVYIPTPYLLI